MVALARPRSRWAYYSVVLAVLLLVAAAWTLADRASARTHLGLAARNRELQLELARSAMEESFLRILEENRVLASYSFTEYLEGRRSPESMQALFASEQESYPESLVYAFYEGPGRPRFVSADPEAEEAAAELHRATAEAWDRLEGWEGPFVSAGGSGPEPFFLIFYPVRIRGQIAGLLGTAVGLHRGVSKYLQPLVDRPFREIYLLSGPERVLWPGDAPLPSTESTFERIVTRRSFRLGSETFTLLSVETRASLLAEMRAIEAPRLIVLFSGILLLALSLYAADRFRAEKLRRAELDEEEARLSAEVEAQKRELEDSELRFEALFEGANEAILIVTQEGRILRCNDRACELLLRDRGRLVGSPMLELSAPLQPNGGSREEYAQQLWARAAAGEAPIFEWIYVDPEGFPIEAEVAFSLVRHGEGYVAQALIRDIGSRKREERILRTSLEEREILLHELHHRVKNNLQVIESLLDLQADVEGSEGKRALGTAKARVSALAAAYLIAAERPETLRIESRVYLTEILAQVAAQADGRGVQLSVQSEIEELPLGLDAAVPLGLALRELAENSAIHGKSASGQAEIEFRFVRDGSRALLELRDHGPGLSAEAREALGLGIARALIRQLGGNLELHPANPGLRAQSSFPLA